MGIFSIDGPLIKLLTRAANMLIACLLWLLCSLPLLTFIPSTASLYHVCVRVLRGQGNAVAKEFFETFIQNLKQGALLSLIAGAIAAVLFACLKFGWNHAGAWWGLAYLIIGFAIALFFLLTLLHIPPVLSRFEGSIPVLLRLSLYFPMKRFLKSVAALAFLGFIVFLIDFFPLLVLILPAVYYDLAGPGIEKAMAADFGGATIALDAKSAEIDQFEHPAGAGALPVLDLVQAYDEPAGREGA